MSIFDLLLLGEKHKREIEREPAWGELLFGDGMVAQLLRISDSGYDDDGLEMVKVIFKPTEALVDKYDIRYHDYDKDALSYDEYQITRKYPRMYMRILNIDPVDARYQLLCCYDGTPGPLMKEKEHLYETIKFLQRKNISMKANVALSQQDADQIINQAEYRDKRMMDRISNIRGKVDQHPGMPYPLLGQNLPPKERETEYIPRN